MRLTQKAIAAIDNQRCRMLIALELRCSEMSIRRYIEANSDELTKAAALKVIKQETGLNEEEILEEEAIKEATK